MDPLSVSASVIGILTVCAKLSSLLSDFVRNTRQAPGSALAVLNEVNALRAALSLLQSYLHGDTDLSNSRGSLILVEQVTVTLAECVTTVSELEETLGTSSCGAEMGVFNQLKWASKESRLAAVEHKLRGTKASLTLMLTILQCSSIEEARNANKRLCDLVEQVLVENRNISKRLGDMTGEVIGRGSLARMMDTDSDEDDSLISGKTPTIRQGSRGQGLRMHPRGLAFEEDLLASRVYRRPLSNESGETLTTFAKRTAASSILSALSLTDVSNISIVAIPIYITDITNSQRYTFGALNPYKSESQRDPASVAINGASGANRWAPFALAIRRGRQKNAEKEAEEKDTGDASEVRVLGVPLHESIKYAHVALYSTNEDGEGDMYGYVPIFVAKPILFIKEHGIRHKDLFITKGSGFRVKKLEILFNSHPGFGKDLDWNGYTVHDAAATMLLFLRGLPEPVIPYDDLETFGEPLRTYIVGNMTPDSPENLEKLLSPVELNKMLFVYKQLIQGLYPSTRCLLLYLLGFLAVLKSNSAVNGLTSNALAAIFQPVILAPPKTEKNHGPWQGAPWEHSVQGNQMWLDRRVVEFLIDHKAASGSFYTQRELKVNLSSRGHAAMPAKLFSSQSM